MSDNMISLEEIGAAQGRKAAQVREEARELGLWIGEDWAGREALSVADARALTSGSARRAVEHDRAWKAFQADVKGYTDARTRAAQEAADAAEEKALRRGRAMHGGMSPGEIHQARREAYLHAGAQYERRYARPRFNGEPGMPLCFLADEAEEGSLKAAVVGRLRGAKAAPGVAQPGMEVA